MPTDSDKIAELNAIVAAVRDRVRNAAGQSENGDRIHIPSTDLMPLVHALLAEGSDTQPGKTNPDAPPIPRPTHKRRNELLPEEI